jgi:hypothetical protein
VAENRQKSGKGHDGEENEARERISWHVAFTEAAKAELLDYLDKLTFEAEYQLTMEPLKMDLLVIKKTVDVVIKKNIGAIFRQFNVLEYKSPTDSLTVSDFMKTMSYAYLYASQEKRTQREMTVTLTSRRYPRELMKYFRSSDIYGVEKRYSGVYYITGDAVAIQVIVGRELDEDENLWLCGLTRDIEPKLGGRVITELERLPDKTMLSAYLDVFLRANEKVMREVSEMARTRLKTLEEVLEDAGVRTEIWVARGKIEMAIAYVNDGDSVEHAARMAGITVEELEKYL